MADSKPPTHDAQGNHCACDGEDNAAHAHAAHDFGITCADCVDGEADTTAGPWYKEPKVIWLAAASILTAAGFAAGLAGAPSPIVIGIFVTATLVGAVQPAKAAYASLLKKTLTINTLLIAAALGALYLTLWEEAATLVIVFSLGGVLETFAVDRARHSLRNLVELAPTEARVIREGVETLLPASMVKTGEFILIHPGDKVSLDGVVAAGVSTVDEASITGESVPAFKKPGDSVFAGTINKNGSLEVKVTAAAKDTTLAKIIHSVEEHQARKSSYQRFGERFSAIYTKAMFVVALIVTLVPPVAAGADFQEWLYRGLVVLVVSCSCGIALSVPVAIVSAIANAARHGVLIKGGVYIELLADVNTIAFDKTGTLTYGNPAVTEIISYGGMAENDLLEIAAAVERKSGHPLAAAIVRAAEERELPRRRTAEFHSVPGLGASALIKKARYHAGNRQFIEAHSISIASAQAAAAKLELNGRSLVYVSEDDRLVGLIAIADTIRESAAGVVADLVKSGIIHTVMLTGDNEGTASAIAKLTGVDEFRPGLLPDQKAEAVVEMEKKYGRVAMVGDGINDAPALAAASVGIAMGAAGSGIAVETADIALMADDLGPLTSTVRLAKRTAATIKFNIAAALTLVIILVSLALLGRIQLVPGLIVNEFGAFLIILNGLRMLR
jgi:Cd2+/Zn2+-exporting ATPase